MNSAEKMEQKLITALEVMVDVKEVTIKEGRMAVNPHEQVVVSSYPKL